MNFQDAFLVCFGTGESSSLRQLMKVPNEHDLREWATRFGPALQHVVGPTQTGFVPDRWIGDSVVCHLEEVQYCNK